MSTAAPTNGTSKPGRLAVIGNRIATAFGYDAAAASNKRKAVSGKIKSEDMEHPQKKRDSLSANMRDTVRNFGLAGFMIRKHLDYVSSFSFHARNADDTLNEQLETLVKVWSRPQNCHVHGRHPFAALIRLAEAHRVIDGDIGLMTLRDGTIQPIEGDLIRDPAKIPKGQAWVNGCHNNARGRTIGYGIHRRTDNGKSTEFAKEVRARNLILHGFFDRFDQLRGVSPLAAALDPLKDLRENFEYALAKAKVSQLFSLVISSDGGQSWGVHTDLNPDETDANKKKYSVKFGTAPQKLELDKGDDAKILESQQPSTQFQDFTRNMIELALKSLDIPTSFYDESHTNFFGSRAAWLHYDRSCIPKRAAVSELLRRLTVWRLRLWIESGDLQLPAGTTLSDLEFEWVPLGMPWWDPAKEIKGELMAMGAGLDNPQRICRARGTDFYKNVDETAAAMEYAAAAGVPLSFALPPESPPEPDE
jgi:capsid protein